MSALLQAAGPGAGAGKGRGGRTEEEERASRGGLSFPAVGGEGTFQAGEMGADPAPQNNSLFTGHSFSNSKDSASPLSPLRHRELI